MQPITAKEHFDKWLEKSRFSKSDIINYDGLIALAQACIDGRFKWQNVKKNTFNYFIEGKVEGDLVERYAKILSAKHAITKDGMILKYGDELGILKWQHYCDLQAKTNTFEYKNEKYGMTKEDFDSYNQSRSVTLENLINRHGEENGTAMFEKYRKRQAYAGCALEYFQEKHGAEEGILIWEKLNKEKAITIENFRRKYGDNIGDDKFLECIEGRKAPYSKPSQELFNMVEDIFAMNGYSGMKSYFATKNKEFCKYDSVNSCIYFIDYVNLDFNVGIEYNGDLYHANPSMYEPDDVPPYRGNKKRASEIWEYDKQKNSFIEGIGLKLIIVWDSEFQTDKQKVAKDVYDTIIEHHKN